jgi:hypothetical protein
MTLLPEKVRTFAKLMENPAYGSERFIARLVLEDQQSIELTFDWLVGLSRSIDVDRKAKRPMVRKFARAALYDLADVILRDSTMTNYRKEAATFACEKALEDMGVKF